MSEQSVDRKTALVVVAHPDDAEFGCGGTIAAWANEGWQVTLVICTDGSAGGPDEATDVRTELRRQLTVTRKREQEAAAKVLGIHEVIFLDYPDGELAPTLELRRDIVRQIRRTQAYRIVFQSPDRVWEPQYMIGRFHPDHLAAGQAAIAAIYPAAQNPWDFPELMAEGFLPSRVKEVYVIGAPLINHAVDISDSIEQKLGALACHVSQLGSDQTELAKRVRSWAVERGQAYNVPMAETFHRIEN